MAKSRSPGLAEDPITTCCHRPAGDLAHRNDVARRAGQGDQRLERGQVDLVGHVVGGVGVGEQFDEVVLALLGAQERPDLVVGREHRGGGAEFGAHVGDHVPVHRGQRRPGPGRGTR